MGTTRQINTIGLDKIKGWEGLRTTAYQDVSGIWTIGYGHTAAAGLPVPSAGMTITEEEAEQILQADLGQYENAVQEAVKVPLNDNQFAALVSFTYNVGINAFKNSTLVKKLNQGQYDAVPDELMKWVNSRGKRIQGLVNRRRAEVGLWTTGEFVTSNFIKPTPLKLSVFTKPEVVGPLIGAISGLAGFATGSGPFQWALATIMVVGVIGGAVYYIRGMKQQAS